MKKILFLITFLAISLSNCTNLDEGIFDKRVADQFYATSAGANAALANIYGEIRGDWGGKGIAGADRGWFDLNEVTTDELMLPTRSDGAWADNGIWRQLYLHQYGAASELVVNTWNWLYRAVFKGNLAVELLTTAKASPEKIAEAKVLRAYFYYLLMDGWGNVPFFTDNNITIDKIPQTDRKTLYNFVVSELTANVPLLSSTKGGDFYGRFNKWAGYALLAKIYLNAQIYTGTPALTEAIANCDKIINEGGFSLHPNYMELTADRCPDTEVILAVFVEANLAPRNIIGIRSLRGAHGQAVLGFSTWNGATAHQNFVNKYSNDDKRKAQWITGAQPGGVNYALNISSITAAGVEEGARNVRYLPDLTSSSKAVFNNNSTSNDFSVFRYADILLMKAEALVRNGSAGTAKALVDQVRARAGVAALSSAPSLDDLYDERGREFCWEGLRRQDMIRFGKYLLAHDFKPASDPKYSVFPIPQAAIDANTNLKQNAGY
ncbi:MAG: RagB/SusD family nutrient uptake outer membrane protein [Bacteroidetes bacterium]|nr:MAG: RagB/SusD family nutrient uptake outer membrane protein [Bacteroidota bacterium]